MYNDPNNIALCIILHWQKSQHLCKSSEHRAQQCTNVLPRLSESNVRNDVAI